MRKEGKEIARRGRKRKQRHRGKSSKAWKREGKGGAGERRVEKRNKERRKSLESVQ